MAEPTQSVEASNPILGSLKVSGPNLNMFFTVGGFFGTCFLIWLVNTHTVDAKDNGKEVAQALKESNREMIQAMKDSNAAVADAMKQVAKEQRRSNELAREQTCLITLPPDRRTNAGEFCKRLSREHDR